MDAYISPLPIKRGQKVAAADVSYYTNLHGTTIQMPDVDYGSTGTKPDLSGMPVTARFVKNAGATALPAGSVPSWSSVGTTVSGLAGSDTVGAGVVDPDISASVAQNERFLLITEGPVEVLVSAALSAGDVIGPSGSGKFGANDKSTVAKLAAVAGRMLEASTADGQLKRAYVKFIVR